MRTRVKICGITDVEQACWAIEAGADAIGLIFYPPSSRYVDTESAAAIVAAVAPWVSVVGVFADQPGDEIDDLIDRVHVDQIQFHGDESADFCKRFRRPWLKGVRMRPDLNLESHLPAFVEARGILVDTYKSGVIGGTGSAFDWSRLAGVDKQKLILAGGLTAANVDVALSSVHPAAIDVSTGVESAPGVKSRERIFEFMSAVQDHDRRRIATEV